MHDSLLAPARFSDELFATGKHTIADNSNEPIIKVTRRLYPREALATIVDRGNTLITQQELSELVKQQMGGATVGYFRGRIVGNKSKQWVIGLPIAGQAW